MPRNPNRDLAAHLQRRGAVERSSGAAVAGAQNSAPTTAGENDPTTGAWEPYGILGRTTGGEGFRLKPST